MFDWGPVFGEYRGPLRLEPCQPGPSLQTLSDTGPPPPSHLPAGWSSWPSINRDSRWCTPSIPSSGSLLRRPWECHAVPIKRLGESSLLLGNPNRARLCRWAFHTQSQSPALGQTSMQSCCYQQGQIWRHCPPSAFCGSNRRHGQTRRERWEYHGPRNRPANLGNYLLPFKALQKSFFLPAGALPASRTAGLFIPGTGQPDLGFGKRRQWLVSAWNRFLLTNATFTKVSHANQLEWQGFVSPARGAIRVLYRWSITFFSPQCQTG